MQETSAKVQSLAERIKKGECENRPVKDLVEEASDFLDRAIGIGMDGIYEEAVEYFKAASEDFDFAYRISVELEEKEKCSDRFHLTGFHLHRLDAKIYLDDKRYYKALEEVNVAKEMYNTIREDFAARDEEIFASFNLDGFIHYLTKVENMAKEGIAEIEQNPHGIVFLQNELDFAVSREMFLYAAELRDKIKLKKIEVCTV